MFICALVFSRVSLEVPDGLERCAFPEFRSGDRLGLVVLDALDASLF